MTLTSKLDTINDMHLCGHFTGHTNIGGRVAVWCPHNTRGRYVQIHILEVLIWDVHVNEHGEFYINLPSLQLRYVLHYDKAIIY